MHRYRLLSGYQRVSLSDLPLVEGVLGLRIDSRNRGLLVEAVEEVEAREVHWILDLALGEEVAAEHLYLGQALEEGVVGEGHL